MSEHDQPPSPPPASNPLPEPSPAPAPAPSGHPVRQTSTLAIVSLVSGILGWTLIPWLGSIAAIITGHMARAEIARNPDTMEGDGLALTGLVLGWAAIVLSVLAVVAVVFFLGGLAVLLGAIGLGSQY